MRAVDMMARTASEEFRALSIGKPFVTTSPTANFTSYGADGFGWPEQVRLHDVALKLKKLGVYVVLSNSGTKLVEELYHDFKLHPVSARRNVNSDASKRGAVGEFIIT
jgi:DNA adenine methylase